MYIGVTRGIYPQYSIVDTDNITTIISASENRVVAYKSHN